MYNKPFFIAFQILITFIFWSVKTNAQPTVSDKENRLAAFAAIKEMKNGGILVVRLETNHVKIRALERNLSDPNLKPAKRKRLQGMLDETTIRRDAINQTLANTFSDSFNFCPVYLSYDSSANTLKNGAKSGIFLNRELKIDPSIQLPDSANIFIAYYHEKSGEFPSDGLMLRKLLKTLKDPFPNYTAIKESFVNDINTPRLRKAILILDNKLKSLLERAEKRD